MNVVSDEVVCEKLRDKNPATLANAVAESKRLAANREIEESRTKTASMKSKSELQQLREKVRQLSQEKETTPKQTGPNFRNKQKGSQWKIRNPKEPPTCWTCAMKGHVARWCPFTDEQIKDMKREGKIPAKETAAGQSN